jgi:hypothetical protein
VPSLASYARLGAHASDWYDRARESVVLPLASESGQHPDVAADVLSITSPRVQLRRNVALAREYLMRGFVSGALPGVVRALETYSADGRIRGPKTSAFSAALKGDHDAVVIDVWLIRALGLNANKGLNLGAYREAAARVTRASRRFGALSPRDFQAAVWVGTRIAYRRTSQTYLPSPKGL